MSICRLCQNENVTLKNSHIVSKMFYNVIKDKSITGIMRANTNPNKGVQDGIKIPFLCEKCEELFSKYETYFSKKVYEQTVNNDGNIIFNSRDDNIAYFLLSISWRVIKYLIDDDEKNNTMNLSQNEKEKLNQILEKWRILLITENMSEIRKIQQFIIPTQKLTFFESNEHRIHSNVGYNFKTFDNEDSFNFAFSFVQVPYFIFITTVWGKTNSMKSYQLGKQIKPCKSTLPKHITELLFQHHVIDFEEAYNNTTEKQKRIIEDRVNSKIKNCLPK